MQQTKFDIADGKKELRNLHNQELTEIPVGTSQVWCPKCKPTLF